MSEYIYSIVVFVLEAVISGAFTANMLQAKYGRPLLLTLWGEICAAIILALSDLFLIRCVVTTVAEFVFIFLMYEDKPKKKIRVLLIRLAASFGSAALAFVLYSAALSGKVTFSAAETPTDPIYCNILYLILLSVTTSVIFQFTRPRRSVEQPWVLGTLAVTGVAEITAVLAMRRAAGGAEEIDFSPLSLAATVCMIGANLSVGTVAPYLVRRVTMSTGMDYGREISSMEYKYYEMSVENEKKLREIKHDISNHIQTVYSLFGNGQDQKGLELINELKARYALVDQMMYCDNPVVNIMLSNKKSEAEAKNIETRIKVKERLDNIPISDFDLSTVIGNLLDNAIRGCVCSEQSHPKMIIEIFEKNGYLVVRVLNSCKIGMVVESTDRIETTKSKSQTHGLGMPIIAGIAKKYRGDFIVSAQNGIFTATAVLSMKEQ